jgi:hypothetical protein
MAAHAIASAIAYPRMLTALPLSALSAYAICRAAEAPGHYAQ